MIKLRLKDIVFLITYTILLVACLIKLDIVLSVISQFFLLLSPIILGGVIAFILKKPYDLIYRKIREQHSDEPIKVDPDFKRPVRSQLHPVERGDYEAEYDDYYRKKIIDMYMKDPDRFRYDWDASDAEYDQYRWTMDKLIRDYIKKNGKDLPN